MILISILAFLVIFSLLILVHEFGHFISARIFGVKVEEFGLGLPPKAKRLFRDKKKTEYTLNWLPLGGFVRMKGEDASSKKLLGEKDSFAAKAVWKRIIIICAGVIMNIFSGFILLSIIFLIGTTQLAPTSEVNDVITENSSAKFVGLENLGILVGEVLEEKPATESGLKAFDFITAINGEIFTNVEEFQSLLKSNIEEEVTLSLMRRKHKMEVTVTPNSEGEIGVAISGPFTAVQLRYPFPDFIFEAGKETWRLTRLITGSIVGLFGGLLHGELPEGIGGPIAIAKETFYRASSILALLNFAALLSITLAVFNILPIPALDGGRLFFLIIEGIIRKKPSPKWEAKIHAVGYVLLLGLLVIVSWQDIFR